MNKRPCDSDILDELMKNPQNGCVIIPPRKSEVEPERTYWLIDRAVLIPENTTVILQNCTIKLSDSCRDNFFRSANCGIGITDVKTIRNLHIRGEGYSLLLGADHPRSTGDSSKILACPCPKKPEDIVRFADWIPEERRSLDKLLFWDAHDHSYGTDAAKDGEHHGGDWRNIGILFACVENFSIENLHMKDYHGWAVSLEDCAFGEVRGMDFDACMAREIDGMTQNSENQDGIDLRNGCHDITIRDIRGGTGDDIVALTAICNESAPFRQSGELSSTHILHNDWSKRCRDIYNVVIQNMVGYSKGGVCYLVRLLATQCKIYNVIINGIIDTSPENRRADGVLTIGDRGYGEVARESIVHVSISDIICNSRRAVVVDGYLKDSVINGIVNRNPDAPILALGSEDSLDGVTVGAVAGTSKMPVVLYGWENGQLVNRKAPESIKKHNRFSFDF